MKGQKKSINYKVGSKISFFMFGCKAKGIIKEIHQTNPKTYTLAIGNTIYPMVQVIKKKPTKKSKWLPWYILKN